MRVLRVAAEALETARITELTDRAVGKSLPTTEEMATTSQFSVYTGEHSW